MFSAQNRIFQNRSRRFSMPSAQLITSWRPSKNLIQALFNGSKLDIVTARGAKNGNGQNRQKSQKKHEIAILKKPQRDSIKEHCRSEETQNHNRKITKNKSTKMTGFHIPIKKPRHVVDFVTFFNSFLQKCVFFSYFSISFCRLIPKFKNFWITCENSKTFTFFKG